MLGRALARVRWETLLRHASGDKLTSAKVSLITVVLNGGTALERTFESVFAQSYQPIDYIVIDGGSTDGSVDLIRRNDGRLAHWISEPDHGISDAFNKGIALATGHYVGLLNADDWLSADQIERAVDALRANDADFVFGDLVYHAPNGDPLHVIRGDPDYARKIDSLMPALNHPTMLVKRRLFDRIGGFDRRYRVAMDYDWVLRAHRQGCRGAYAPGLVGHMTLQGTSDRRFIQGLAEVRAIAIDHGQPAGIAWPLFGFRVAKGLIRRLIQRHAPSSLYRMLRRWANRDFRTPTHDVGMLRRPNPPRP